MNDTPAAHSNGPTLTRRLLRGGFWVFFGRVMGIGLAFAISALLARQLSYSDFGIFLFTVNLLTFTGIVARFGLDRVLVKLISQSLAAGNATRARRTVLLGAVIGAMTSLLCSLAWLLFVRVFGIRFLELPDSPGFQLYTAGALVLATFLMITAEAFRGYHDLRFSSLFSATASGPLVSAVFLIFLGFSAADHQLGLETTLLFYLGAFIVVLPIALAVLWRTITRAMAEHVDSDSPDVSDRVKVGALLPQCLPIMLSQVLAFACLNGDVWLAAAWQPGDSLALYGAGRRLVFIVMLPLQMLNQTVLSAIPVLYGQQKLNELQKLLQTTATLAAVPSCLVILVIVIAPGPILELVFGPFYRSASIVLTILAIGLAVQSLTGACEITVVMSGYHNYSLVVNMIAALVLLVVGSVAAIGGGITGLAVASTAVLIVKRVALWLLAHRLAGVWTHVDPFRLHDWLHPGRMKKILKA